jgi:hypothetical protein
VSALPPVHAPAQAVRADDFWAGEVIFASYRFLASHAGAILAALWLPLLLAAATLLATFKVYFTLLALYLVAPDARLASLTASATVVGLLVWLFLNAIVTARVARVVGGERVPGLLEFRAMAPEARLYAALLRYLLVLVIVGILGLAAVRFVAGFLPGMLSDYALWFYALGMAAFAIVFSLRCGLLMPVLALRERQRILRRSWELSRGRAWQFALLWLALTALPTILIQMLSEFLMRSVIEGFADAGSMTLATAADSLAAHGSAIAAIVLTLTLSSLAGIVPTTVGSYIAYSRLGQQP